MRIEPPPPRISTSRVAEPGRGPAIVGLLALAFVAAGVGSALVTGTSQPVTRSDGQAARFAPPVSPVAIQAPRAIGLTASLPPATDEPSLRPGEIACMPAGWRLAYVGSIGAWRVETWLVVEPVVATDPLDARIPVTQLGHDVVTGLGACAPPTGPDGGGRPSVIEHAWRVDAAGGAVIARPIGLVPVGGAPAIAAGPRTDALALVRPQGPAAGWAAGDYVLEIAPGAVAGQGTQSAPPAWLRIRLEAPTP